MLVDAEDNCFKSSAEVDTLLSDDCIVFNALKTSLEPLVKLDDFEFNWFNPSCIVFIPSAKETAPLFDYYKNKNLLKTINAEGSIDEVWERLLKVIND